jgi:hypothetical protein
MFSMLDIGFTLRWVPRSSGGLSAMADDDYIRNLRETLIARAKIEGEQTRKENRESDLIASLGPQEWNQLRDAIKSSIDKLPSEIVRYEDGDIDSLQIVYERPRGNKRTKVEFSHIEGVFTRIDVSGSCSLTFECIAEGRKVFWSRSANGQKQYDVDGMLEAILSEATKP